MSNTQKMKQSFDCIRLSGNTKDLLVDALNFLVEHITFPINSFLVDDTGYLVLCHTFLHNGVRTQSGFLTNMYPFEPNAIVLAEHIYQYLNNLTNAQREAMGAAPDGSEESYEYGWELFTPDWYSDDYKITDYRDGSTLLAVKPKLIEYGK